MARVIRRPVDLTLRMSEASEQAHAKLLKQQLRLPEQPDYEIPGLPEDITELDDQMLMALFTLLTSWADYVTGQLACAQIDERSIQKSLDISEATALLGGWKGGSDARVAIAKAAVATDPEVLRLRDGLDEAHAYRKLIEVLSNNLERDAALVSREITRRSAAEPRRARANRWSN